MLSHLTPINRRQMIHAGLGGLASLALPDLLRLRAQSSDVPSDRAIIYVLQEGGAPQIETYDPKPDADDAVRGEFSAIATNVPSVRFSEILPRQASIMDKLVILRSVHHASTQHSSSVHLIKTGYYCRPEAEVNEMPSMGAYISRLMGSRRSDVPSYVAINRAERYGLGHFLGPGYNPFVIRNDNDDNPNATGFLIPNLSLVEGVNTDLLADRRSLLASFDRTRRALDLPGESQGIDDFRRQAYEMVTGNTARRAFDLDAEPGRIRDRYGRNRLGQSLLLARRLVEHGISFVTVGTFNWDFHSNLWQQMRRDVPPFDHALTTLIEDLHERGLANRVLVVVMGEFGRTPRYEFIGRNAPGRDHWGAAMSVAMAGGGLNPGRVIGATDRMGERVTQSPIRLEQVLATMYRWLGIDPATTFVDATGRPRYLLETRDPIVGL